MDSIWSETKWSEQTHRAVVKLIWLINLVKDFSCSIGETSFPLMLVYHSKNETIQWMRTYPHINQCSPNRIIEKRSGYLLNECFGQGAHAYLSRSFNHTKKNDAVRPDRVLFHLIEQLESFFGTICFIQSTHQTPIVYDALFHLSKHGLSTWTITALDQCIQQRWW